MSDKCILSQCCCGCTLRTGALSTAIICLIGGILNIIAALYNALNNHAGGSWLNVVIYAVVILIAILLLIGVNKENPKLIKAWVYIQAVLTVLAIVGLIVTAISGFAIFDLIVNLAIIAVFIYFILVVRSYAYQLESGGGTNTV